MDKIELINKIKEKRSYLCVGLDSDPKKLPDHLSKDAEGMLTFNKAIIDATAKYAIAYKPNAAFYEALGSEGWKALEETILYIKDNHPDCLVILDSKRGDIGNTSGLYARSAFEQLGADAITVAPYMGEDSVKPFLNYKGKWVILLALTSNMGANDFQQLEINGGLKVYEQVLEKSQEWATSEEMMYVCGATQASYFERIRKLVPDHFLLVPGVGAQGGSLQEVSRYGMTKECGLLVNSSRGIIFASKGKDFAEAAGEQAHLLQKEMDRYLTEFGKI